MKCRSLADRISPNQTIKDLKSAVAEQRACSIEDVSIRIQDSIQVKENEEWDMPEKMTIAKLQGCLQAGFEVSALVSEGRTPSGGTKARASTCNEAGMGTKGYALLRRKGPTWRNPKGIR